MKGGGGGEEADEEMEMIAETNEGCKGMREVER